MGREPISIVGQRFHRLVVLHRGPNGSLKDPVRWICLCDCGNTKNIASSDLRRGSVKSCGCLLREDTMTPEKRRGVGLRHGGKRRPEYNIWCHIKQRCCNPKAGNYTRYGAIGVTVCDEWKASFAAFFAHVGPRPSSKYSIDRIDPSGNYEPGNVRWADAHTQRINRRKK